MLVTVTYRCGHRGTESASKARARRIQQSAPTQLCSDCWVAETREREAQTPTDRQIAYALDLNQRNPGVTGRSYTHDELRAMGRDEISQLIDLLRESL